MKKILFTGVAILATFSVFAQKHTDQEMRTHPYWIQMMDQEVVNYDEVQNAFDLYWEGKKLPTEENELFQATDKESLSFQRESDNLEASVQYAFEYKKCKHWLIKNEQFIKADRTVMNPEERILQWKQQQLNRK